MGGEVRVHAVGIVLVVPQRGLVEFLHLLFRDPAPAQRADERVGGHLARAEQFREPPGRHVAAEVHLPEPVLGLHVALGAEQIVRGSRFDLGHPGVVAGDRDGLVEPGDLDRPGGLRERSRDGPDSHPSGHHDREEEHRRDDAHGSEDGAAPSQPGSVVAHAAPSSFSAVVRL